MDEIRPNQGDAVLSMVNEDTLRLVQKRRERERGAKKKERKRRLDGKYVPDITKEV